MAEAKDKAARGGGVSVSVVVTCYNVEKWVGRAVRSALGQTGLEGGLEVVAVDDCSTDGTAALLDRLSEEDPRLRVVRKPANGGAGLARRTGIEASRGRSVLLLDADDWLDADFVSRLARRMEETGAEIVSGGVTVHREDGSAEAVTYGETVETGADRLTAHFGERIVFMNNKLIARRLHGRVPYCGRRYIEDTPVIAKMLWHATKVAYVDTPGYHYMMNPASLTHNTSKARDLVFRALCAEELCTFFADKGADYVRLFHRGLFDGCMRELAGLRPTAADIAGMTAEWAEAWRLYALHAGEPLPRCLSKEGRWFHVDAARGFAFANVAKCGLTTLRGVLLSDLGLKPAKGAPDARLAVHRAVPRRPGRTLVPVADMRGWEAVNGRVEKIAVWRDPVERLCAVWRAFFAEGKAHPYFSELRKSGRVRFFADLIRLAEEELRLPVEEQDEHLRRQSDTYTREDVDLIVPLDNLTDYLRGRGVADVPRLNAPRTCAGVTPSEDEAAAIRALYAADYALVRGLESVPAAGGGNGL